MLRNYNEMLLPCPRALKLESKCPYRLYLEPSVVPSNWFGVQVSGSLEDVGPDVRYVITIEDSVDKCKRLGEAMS